MSSDDEDEEPVREPVEAGDIVLFTRFGNGVSSELVGRLGVLLETNETRRWIHAFDEDEPVRRRCVRVRADNGETVGARIDQLECWCNTGTTLPEVLVHLRTTEASQEQGRQLRERATDARRVVEDLIEKLRQTPR